MILEALGLSVGDIELTLPRSDFARGARITGSLKLKLSEDVEAKRLVVGIRARQRAIGIHPASSGGLSVDYSNHKAFEFIKELSGQRTYVDGETMEFELLIPDEGTQPRVKLPGGLLGDLTQILAALASVQRFPLEWQVFAFLDRPWQLNPKGEAQFQLVDSPKKTKKKKVSAKKPKKPTTRAPRKKKTQTAP